MTFFAIVLGLRRRLGVGQAGILINSNANMQGAMHLIQAMDS